MYRRQAYLATWLILLTVAQAAALLAVYRIFVQTRTGQAVDTISLTANWIGSEQLHRPVTLVLNTMSVVSLALVTALVLFIAVYRRRYRLAVVAFVVIAGANVTTQLLKLQGLRPEYGIDPERTGNTLPSGHTTIAASVAIAFILVLPRAISAAGTLALAGWAAFAGVATLAAGWHRPSDAVAAFLVAGAWASAAGLLLVPLPPALDSDGSGSGRVAAGGAGRFGSGWAAGVLLIGGVAALVLAALLLWLTHDVINWSIEELSRTRSLVAYAGGAAGIAGTAGVVLGLIAATVPHLVPPRSHPVAEASPG
ncbi:membrane-associated phospholipid phosphatase [Catenuloplanes nepalensis]|uniref:Membrane-associated phospholipid phosphatase n=1 Tax=Catenuloplanes nepalensis TaxID=587533 RepID=A0ABT9MYP0_9ACTN|nr:phosphatase PAP2 family protein [Catenuloplanes nepalensis]MDP9796569.1 membrane-associated phospholipid phosphatase [Catenuloplanes nepalensis]